MNPELNTIDMQEPEVSLYPDTVDPPKKIQVSVDQDIVNDLMRKQVLGLLRSVRSVGENKKVIAKRKAKRKTQRAARKASRKK